MKALGIVIFSHIRSRISSPESGCAIALTTVCMSVLTDKLSSPMAPVRAYKQADCTRYEHETKQ